MTGGRAGQPGPCLEIAPAARYPWGVMRKIWGIVLVGVLAASCSTIPYGQRPDSIKRIVDLVNAGNAKALAAASSVPFSSTAKSWS